MKISEEALWMMKRVLSALSIRRRYATLKGEILAWMHFWKSYRLYCEMTSKGEKPDIGNLYPCLGDDRPTTPIDPVYFYQNSWAFERIVRRSPSSHIDVGSHHTFVALLSKVVPVTMVDIRPLSLPLASLEFRQGSILNLPFEDGSVSSLSSLCVIEHIGLGRYGDPLDPWGTEKAVAELKRILAPGGILWLSVPVSDKNVTHFNAGRVFSIGYILQLIEPLRIIEQAYIVGNSLQGHYEHKPWFGTTALFELKKPQE
jgi:SAM-dependent methyltransferase